LLNLPVLQLYNRNFVFHPMPQKHYDYIITGAGCAGLSLALHLLQSGAFGNKKILLVDEASKDKNDRTWCFWETGEGLFESIVFRKWERLWFYGEDIQKEISIEPHRYKMIRGIDFYDYCFQRLNNQLNFEFLHGKVERLLPGAPTGVVVNGETIFADFVFNSILFEKPLLSKKQHWFLQHFKGWQVKTPTPVFNTGAATLMDFRISQQHGTAFCYVLPYSPNEALIEYTLFTPGLLKPEEYDEGLKHYIEDLLRISSYQITDTEFGVIPMTNYPFPKQQGNIVNIGTAGGQTKGSSGYTFYFIQQHSKAIVASLQKTGKPFTESASFRFPFYDSVLLQVLQTGSMPGKQIFSTMFKKNTVTDVLQFLNNESSLVQELKIISSLPTLPFLKAAAQQVF
jgi:lycopene beta-cyclase